MNKVTYWAVSHSPDTTETGMFMQRTYIRAEWVGHAAQEHTDLVLEQWCFERFGPKVDYVQGVAAVPGWNIHESTAEQWREARGIKWGGFMHKATRLQLRVGVKTHDGEHVQIMSEEKQCSPMPADWELKCPHCGQNMPEQP